MWLIDWTRRKIWCFQMRIFLPWSYLFFVVYGTLLGHRCGMCDFHEWSFWRSISLKFHLDKSHLSAIIVKFNPTPFKTTSLVLTNVQMFAWESRSWNHWKGKKSCHFWYEFYRRATKAETTRKIGELGGKWPIKCRILIVREVTLWWYRPAK